jgi:uncharacterized protein (TIGR03663 family)
MAAAVGVLGVFVLGVAAQFAILVGRDLGPSSAGAPPTLTTADIAIILAMLTVVGVLCGLVVYVLLRKLLPDTMQDIPVFDLAVLLGVVYLPALSPFVHKLPGIGFDPIDYSTAGIVRSAAWLVVFLAVSIAVGLWWNWRRFLVAGGIWYGIFAVLYTTVFTNAKGLATGMIGNLGYWLVQQGVQRGSQPPYYYLIIVPIYEYLPLIVSLIAIVVYVVRGFRFPVDSAKATDESQAFTLEHETTTFVLLLVYWIALTWIAYSYAGEKMPWLAVHFALPMILLSGHFIGRVFEKLDWKSIARGWTVAILVPLFFVALGMMAGALGTGAFRGKELAQLNATGQWLTAFIVGMGALVALSVIVPQVGWGTSARIVGLEALALLATLTVRTAWQWNYINYDYPIEFGVYAHGGPGVKIAMSQIEDISKRTAGDHALKLVYDSDSSWPFSWYLRDYTNAAYVPNNPTRDQLNAPVIIAGNASWTTYEAILGDRYDKYTYRLIWWPMEDYKGKSNKTLSSDEIVYALTNRQMLRAIFDIWLNRDYKLYDQLTGKTDTPDKWPLAHDFRLYVRKDISNQMWDQHIGPVVSAPPAVDPYLKGRRDIAAVQVIGEPGDAQGKFNAPHGLAVAPDGSLYVADSNNHRIQKFDPSGKFLMAFGTFSGPNNPNPAPGTFNEPWGVAVGSDGSVYVADTWNHRIQKFDATGKFITAWGVAGQTEMGGQGGIFWGPRDVAVGQDGRVYVSDAGNKRIQVFSAEGVFQAQFGGAGVQPGQLDEPVGLAVAPDGNLVVNDTWNQRIQVLSPEGLPIREWEVKGWLDQSVTNKPYVAVDKDGNVYTTDPTGFRVLVFGPDGTFKAMFGDLGTDEKSFQLPIGIAVDAYGDVYVSDAGLARILKFPSLDLGKK